MNLVSNCSIRTLLAPLFKLQNWPIDYCDVKHSITRSEYHDISPHLSSAQVLRIQEMHRTVETSLCEGLFEFLHAESIEIFFESTLLCDVPINAMGKNIVICVYRQLRSFLQANAFKRQLLQILKLLPIILILGKALVH